MEPNLDGTSLASEIDARMLFAAKLSALAAPEPATEPAPSKKRGSFLTRRFFGVKDKKDSAPPAPQIRRERPAMPPPVLPSPTVPDVLVSPVEGTLAYGLTPAPEISVQASPATSDASDAAAEISAPVVPAPATPPPSVAPVPADLPPPRLTVPSFQPPPHSMTPIPSTHSSPAGRASAQLTLGFEITSLQLSPFFRLASVQLKALSNVASLHLVADKGTGQPLAAGISFGIERVELDDAAHLKSLLLKPLDESREAAAPVSRLHVDNVALGGEQEDAPISVTTSGTVPTTVQLVGTFAIAAMEFSPSFEIDSLRLEPASNTVLLRVAPSAGPGAQNLPSSFEIAALQLDEGAQWRGARLVPSMPGKA